MSVTRSLTDARPSASQARISVGKLDGHPSFQEPTKLDCHKGDINVISRACSHQGQRWTVWYSTNNMGSGDQAQLIPTQFCHPWTCPGNSTCFPMCKVGGFSSGCCWVPSLSHAQLCDPTDGLQYARLPCPSPSPRVCSNSCLLSWWCHPTISSSVVPFSSCPQSFPASGSFPVRQLFASGGQSVGTSVSASVLPVS